MEVYAEVKGLTYHQSNLWYLNVMRISTPSKRLTALGLDNESFGGQFNQLWNYDCQHVHFRVTVLQLPGTWFISVTVAAAGISPAQFISPATILHVSVS